jgi:translocation and assembly module TamB
LRRLAALLGVLVLAALAALAQAPGEDDNGFLLNLLERQLSTPERQIRLSGVSGALSSRARIARITISDRQGPWLEIENAEIDWTRLALLRGRVDINRLSAERIAWLRRAETPAPTGRRLPQAEATPFAVPELPVSIRVQELSLPSVSFAEPVFGQAAELAATGSLDLVSGALDATLDIERRDGPGGTLFLRAAFSNQTRLLDVDLALREPQGGLAATLLRIEGRPAIDLTLQGSGPLDQVDVTFALDADQERVAQGVVALRATDAGLGFDADFGGEIAPLVPAAYRGFFAGRGSIQVRGVSKATGGLRIDELRLAAPVLRLDAELETGADGFLRTLNVNGTLGDPAGPAVVLPVPGGRTRLHSAVLYANYGAAARWNGLLVLDRLEAGDIAMEDVTLRLGGLAERLDDPARRHVTVNVEGLATGVWAPDPDVARALGTRLDLFADATLPPGGPITLHQLQLSGNGVSVFTAGQVENLVYTGRGAIRAADIGVFGGLAGRELSGDLNLRAIGSVTPLSGAFDLSLDGVGTDLRLGDTRLDRLLAGETTLGGRAVRDDAGFRTENLRIENPQLSFASDGRIASAGTDIGFRASLTDLADIDPRLSGMLTAGGQATGTGRPIHVALTAAVPEGTVMGRRLTSAEVGFNGDVDGGDVTGSLSGSGGLDGLVMRLAGDLAVAGESRSLNGLEVAVGPNRLTGEIARNGTAPAVGQLSLQAPDIAPVAALALVEATGSIDADIGLAADGPRQTVTVTARARDVRVSDTVVAELDANARVADALGLPLVQGDLSAGGVTLAGVEIASLSATGEQLDPDRMRVTAETRLAIGTLADLSGELARLDGGFTATLDTLRLRHQAAAATLTAPSTVTVRDGAVELTPLSLDFGTGSLTAQGRMAENFDIDVAVRDMPLDLANAVRPDLGLAGRVNGTARVTGPRDAPDVRFNLGAAGVAAAATRSAGLPPLALTATGATAGGRLNLDARVGSESGLAARAQGSLPLGAGSIDLALNLQAFPLILIDPAAGNQGLRGTVTGTGRVTGTLAAPAATFDLRGQAITARVLAENQVPPLGLTAAGEFRAGTVTLRSARVTGAGGMDVTGSGRIPLAGPGLDVRVDGALPLAMADPLLAERAAQVRGVVRVNATVTGALAAPRFAGTVSLQGGTLVDPDTNIRLNDIALDAALDGTTATLRSFRATSAAGGSITAQGRVTIDAARGFPADLTASLNDLRYTDGEFVSTRLAGQLALQGPLTGGGGLLSGSIALGRTEISVAEGLGAGQAALDQVDHIRPPPPVVETLDRARLGESRAAQPRTATTPGLGLDVRISAPNQIFVRGRGLDVELGGELRVQGRTDDIQPVGQFELRRGRLLVLGQRIDFDEGSLQLVGNLDPQLHFVAETTSGDVTAIITVEGRASAPEINFTSEPPLPEDEVLARVLFNRATANLSPFQAAQLAAAAAELAGGGGNGLLSQIRDATGLDDLDIVTEEGGATAVRAGRYLSESVYMDVQHDTEGVSRAQLNYEINERLTARGSVGTDGNTTIGIFFERDF